MSTIKNTQDQKNCRYKSRVNEQKLSPLRILCLYYLRKWITLLSIVWVWVFLTEIVSYRSESPPVPAVKNRLHQAQQKQTHASNFLVQNTSRRERNAQTDPQQRSSPPPAAEAARPPSSQFVPYVRTHEVYCLDPDAPVTRPSTHDPQYRQFNGTETHCELIRVEEMLQRFSSKCCNLFNSVFVLTEFCCHPCVSQPRTESLCNQMILIFKTKQNHRKT